MQCRTAQLISGDTPLSGADQVGEEHLGIGINGDGWRCVQETVDREEIIERLGAEAVNLDHVLAGAVKPSTLFIAAALLAFPLSFSDLFTIRIPV